MANKNTAALYIRLSKEDLDSGDRESESIQNQRSMLLKYAVEHEWDVYSIYCDEDYSGAYAGADNDRPQFNRMIADAEAGRFSIVLCKSQSRFSRNMEVIEQYIHGRFSEWGIRFVSLVDNADTAVRGNKKARQINSLINEWYLEDLSENVRAVFRDKMRKGEFIASFPPYGYMKDKEHKNHLIPHPVTASVVQQIFRWHAEGYGAARISRMLNEQGIPNPRKQQEIDGLRKKYMYAPGENGRWSNTTIGDILNNPAYCGDVVQHTKEKVSYKSRVVRRVRSDEHIVVADMHEPLITREEYERTQKRLSQHRHASGNGMVHILSGKVFCHYCGKPMQKNHCATRKSGHIGYLRCRDKYAYSEKDRCLTPNVRIDYILRAIQSELTERFAEKSVESIDRILMEQLITRNSERGDMAAAERQSLEKERERLEATRKKLYADRLNEVISAEEYLEYSKPINERYDEVKTRLSQIAAETAEKKDTQPELDELRSEVMKLLKTHSLDRDIINALVDRIEFGEIDAETGKPIMRIYWNWE